MCSFIYLTNIYGTLPTWQVYLLIISLCIGPRVKTASKAGLERQTLIKSSHKCIITNSNKGKVSGVVKAFKDGGFM